MADVNLHFRHLLLPLPSALKFFVRKLLISLKSDSKICLWLVMASLDPD